MTRARWLAAVLILAAFAAFALRPLIYSWIIVPLAYVWWLIGLYYRLIPQIVIWIVLVTAVAFIAFRELLLAVPLKRFTSESRAALSGPLESLADLLRKQPRGIYYRWLIANRLGKLARDLLDQRDGRATGYRFNALRRRNWNPSPQVAAYLDVGLNGSFADFPRSRATRETPLDEPAAAVVAYLEGEMEIDSNGHR